MMYQNERWKLEEFDDLDSPPRVRLMDRVAPVPKVPDAPLSIEEQLAARQQGNIQFLEELHKRTLGHFWKNDDGWLEAKAHVGVDPQSLRCFGVDFDVSGGLITQIRLQANNMKAAQQTGRVQAPAQYDPMHSTKACTARDDAVLTDQVLQRVSPTSGTPSSYLPKVAGSLLPVLSCPRRPTVCLVCLRLSPAGV
jgi:hypothetical protein